MDPITHAAAGVVIAHLVSPEAGWLGVGVAAGAALLPDLDLLEAHRRPKLQAIMFHHGPTHSVLSATLLGGGFGSVAGLFFAPQQVWGLALLGVLACWSHILLDTLMVTSGVLLLWPFSRRGFAFPVVLELNPRVIPRACMDMRPATCARCQFGNMFRNPVAIILIGGGLATLLLRPWSVAPAWGTLFALLLYVLAAGWQARRSERAVARLVGVEDGEAEVVSFPAHELPRRRLVIVSQNGSREAYLVEGWRAQPRSVVRLPATGDDPLIRRTLEHPDVAGFCRTTRITHAHRRPSDRGHLVVWRNLAVIHADPCLELASLHVRLDDEGNVVEVEFRDRREGPSDIRWEPVRIDE
jgi:membrane-bound metal-dependent hydrolase YbcI (DUF457 family)